MSVKNSILPLDQAARLSGIPAGELREAFEGGLLAAVKLDNTGVYHVEEAELERYLRASRKEELSDRAALRRILIIEDDLRYAESLQLHLERDGRLDARIASWGKDAVALLHGYKPHLALLGWREPDDRLELIVEVLGLRTIKAQTRLLAYGGNTTRTTLNEERDPGLEALGIGSLLSKAQGQGELVLACYPALLLDPDHSSTR
jgi:hypothetical protein